MARSPEQAEVNVVLNEHQAAAKLKELQERSANLRSEMKKLRDANDKAGYDKLTKELKAVVKEEKILQDQTIAVQKVMKDLNGTSFNDLTKTKKKLEAQMKQFTDRSSEGYNNLRDKVKLLNTEINRTKSEMNASLPFVERANNFFNNYSGIIMATVASLAALILSLKSVASHLMDFEKGFTNVKTTLSADDLAKYGKILETGVIDNIRKYGFEVNDVNKALFDTVSAGIPAAQALRVLDQSSQLAIGGVTDLSTATDGMTTVINAWKVSLSDADQVAAAFFASQKAGKTTVDELSSEIGKVAPLAAQAGISYKETLALLAELTKGGISTAESTTYLKSTISSLLNPTAEAKKVLTELGVPFGVTGIRAKGFSTVLQKLNEVAEKNPDIISKAITSTEALTAVAVLSGEGLKDYALILEQVNNDYGANSSLAAAYAMQQKTSDQAMKLATASMSALVLEMRDDFQPVLKRLFLLLSSGSNILKKTLSFLFEHKTAIKEIAKVLTLFASVVIGYNIGQAISNNLTKAATWLTNTYKASIAGLTAAKNFLTGATVAADAATEGLNKTMKANPLGLVISLISVAVTAFVTYKDSVADANTEQEKFNTLLERTKELKKSTSESIDLAKGMSSMNKRQLEDLRSKAETDLQTFEDLQIQINVKKEELKKQQEIDKKAAEEERRFNAAHAATFTGTVATDVSITKANKKLETTKKQLADLEAAISQYDKFELERIKNTSNVKIAYFDKVEKETVKKTKQISEPAKAPKDDPRLDLLESLAEKTSEINLQLAKERQTANEREIDEIRRKYATEIEIAKEGEKIKDDWTSGFRMTRLALESAQEQEIANKKLEQEKEIIAKKLEQEQRFEEAKRKARDQFGLTTISEQEIDELLALSDAYAQNLIDSEDFEKAKTEITEKYAKKRADADIDAIEKSKQARIKEFETAAEITQTFSNFFSAAKEAELDAAGENEEKKKQIQKKYAGIELAIAASQIITDTAVSILKVSSQLGAFALPMQILIGATGLAQLALVSQQKAKIAGLEDGGYFDVQRAQDGKMFRSTFSNRRGYFNRPTVLVGEHNKPEYVVSSTALSNPFVRNLVDIIDLARVGGSIPQFDYQNAISSVQSVRGYESGGFTQTNTQTPGYSSDKYVTRNDLALMMKLIQDSNAANAAMIRRIQVVNNVRDTDQVISDLKKVENRANL